MVENYFLPHDFLDTNKSLCPVIFRMKKSKRPVVYSVEKSHSPGAWVPGPSFNKSCSLPKVKHLWCYDDVGTLLHNPGNLEINLTGASDTQDIQEIETQRPLPMDHGIVYKTKTISMI